MAPSARTEEGIFEGLAKFERHDIVQYRVYNRYDVIQEARCFIEHFLEFPELGG
jgi:hypothetical protein